MQGIYISKIYIGTIINWLQIIYYVLNKIRQGLQNMNKQYETIKNNLTFKNNQIKLLEMCVYTHKQLFLFVEI